MTPLPCSDESQLTVKIVVAFRPLRLPVAVPAVSEARVGRTGTNLVSHPGMTPRLAWGNPAQSIGVVIVQRI